MIFICYVGLNCFVLFNFPYALSCLCVLFVFVAFLGSFCATSFLMIYHEVFFLDCCGFAQPLGSIEWAIVYIKGRLCGYGVPESGVFAIS